MSIEEFTEETSLDREPDLVGEELLLDCGQRARTICEEIPVWFSGFHWISSMGLTCRAYTGLEAAVRDGADIIARGVVTDIHHDDSETSIYVEPGELT